MHTAAAALLIVAGAALAAPAPAEQTQERRSFPVGLKAPANSRQFSDDLDTRLDFFRDQSINFRTKYKSHLSNEGKRNLKRDIGIRDAKRRKRASMGATNLIDVNVDASYAAQVGIGTPTQYFDVIMDTGSSDLWVVDSSCTVCQSGGLATFNIRGSSSLRTSSNPFEVSYGSGDVSGTLATETVSMAGFSLTDQYFGLVDSAVGTNPDGSTTTLIDAPLSGLMGLAFQRLTVYPQTTTPWWQRLAQSQWQDPEFGVFMKRYRGQSSASDVENNGGEIVFGGVNTSMFTGSLNYVSIPATNEDYWRIPVDAVTLEGKDLGYSSKAANAAIDTGTTMIAAPASVVRAVYRAIPGSMSMSSIGMDGYYAYPCSTTVNFAMTYGGISYPIHNDDFNMGPADRTGQYCMGGIFTFESSANSPLDWIVGATFLKNVYTAFRYSPTAIGFATLADGVQVAGNDLGTTTQPNPVGNGGTNSSNNGGNLPTGSSSGSGNGLGGNNAAAAGFSARGALALLASSLAASLLL